jgi:hypothetical protein
MSAQPAPRGHVNDAEAGPLTKPFVRTDSHTAMSSVGNIFPLRPKQFLSSIEDFIAPEPQPQQQPQSPPLVKKSIAGYLGIQNIDQPAITPFPNPAGLKHPSLAILEFQIGQLVTFDSDYTLTKTK